MMPPLTFPASLSAVGCLIDDSDHLLDETISETVLIADRISSSMQNGEMLGDGPLETAAGGGSLLAEEIDGRFALLDGGGTDEGGEVDGIDADLLTLRPVRSGRIEEN